MAFQEKWFRNSVGIRVTIIGVLILLLLIPTLMVCFLIDEREGRSREVIYEVASKWGEEQMISGPVLVIPYTTYEKDDNDKWIKRTAYAHVLPDQLNINGEIFPEIRYRGIYEMVLYNTRFKVKGSFSFNGAEDLGLEAKDVKWDEVQLAFGISDMKGIKDDVKIRWNQSELAGSPGFSSEDIFDAGVNAKVNLKTDANRYDFEFDINLNGSHYLQFVPLGKQTQVNLSSTWDNPSFVGAFLPENREISKKGFSAQWKVLSFNRNYPQKWIDKKYNLASSVFGVKLRLPVDQYQKSMRVAKYAIMFLGLTFLSFFMVEILCRKTPHPIQYLLIGFTLVLFYVLLLSFSEYMMFQYAYCVSSISVIALISTYTRSILADKRLAFMIAGILTVLYAFLYVLVQLQDFSLLMGSVGLLSIVAVVMYLTRKVDWYNVLKSEETARGKTKDKDKSQTKN